MATQRGSFLFGCVSDEAFAPDRNRFQRGDRFVRKVAFGGEVRFAAERGAGTTVDLSCSRRDFSAPTLGTALQAASNVGCKSGIMPVRRYRLK